MNVIVWDEEGGEQSRYLWKTNSGRGQRGCSDSLPALMVESNRITAFTRARRVSEVSLRQSRQDRAALRGKAGCDEQSRKKAVTRLRESSTDKASDRVLPFPPMTQIMRSSTRDVREALIDGTEQVGDLPTIV